MRSIDLAIAAMALLVAGSTATAQDVSADPTFATINLSAGFRPDPQRLEVVSGGNVPAENISSDCEGYIADVPDVRVNYTSGDYPLTFSVRASEDTTLVINAPDGRWYCDDDGAGDLNPLVHFTKPTSGAYDIFVGNYDDDNADATLSISETHD